MLKTADPVAAPAPAAAPDMALRALRALRTKMLNQEVLGNMGTAALIGGGAGLLIRGGQGLLSQGRHNLGQPPRSAFAPQVVDIPYRHDEEKQASFSQMVSEFLGGQKAEIPSGHPLNVPATMGALGAGAMGGWSALDYLLDARRKSELDIEEQKARAEYEQALAAQHKVASALNADLDRLYEQLAEPLIKQAEIGDYLPNWDTAGAGSGLYLAGAGGLAGVSGIVAYQLAKKRQEGALVQKAMKRHERQLSATRPTPIFIRPVPVPGAPTDDEMDGEPLDQ